MASRLAKADNDELVSAYAKAAAIHGMHSFGGGDPKTANKQYATLMAIYRELKDRGEPAQRCLLQLIQDPNLSVRLWAATHALDFAPEVGVPVLESLSLARSLMGLTARYTLKEWRKGTLRFDGKPERRGG